VTGAPGRAEVDADLLRYRSGPGRWALAAVILGSGAAFLEGSVVSIALPAIGRDFDLELGGLQWIVNGYMIALSSLIVLGGSLGDQYGRRRIFVMGAVGFSVTSVLCALAPNVEVLVAARVLQGAAGAMMVPGSLAILEASFAPEDRGPAIGAWAGWAGISTAIGPFAGGALVDSVSWRLVFLIVVLVAGPAAIIALRHIPESRDEEVTGRPDWLGAALVSVGLGALVYALVEAGGGGAGEVLVLTTGASNDGCPGRSSRSACSGRGSSPEPTSRRSPTTSPSVGPSSSSRSSSRPSSATAPWRPVPRPFRPR
jgi:MFS family permease